MHTQWQYDQRKSCCFLLLWKHCVHPECVSFVERLSRPHGKLKPNPIYSGI